MATILLVEDEASIAELICFNLVKEGHRVEVIHDGLQALAWVERTLPDLVILDLMLPGKNGLEICRIWRQKGPTASLPIIMLTARGEEMDKVLGLEMGADDYITKPFSPRELVARVKARLRRLSPKGEEQEEELIKAGALVIHPQKYQVWLAGEKLDLTPKEYELLKLLATHPGKVFTRDYLLDKIWGYDFFGDSRTVDVHIRHLRQKMEKDGSSNLIETVRGVGYKFKEQ